MREPLKTAISGMVLLVMITALPSTLKIFKESAKQVIADQADMSPPGPPSATPTDWTFLATVGVIALAVLVGAALIFVAWRYVAKRGVETRALRGRRAAQVELWQQGITTLAEVSEALMAFECDPESVYFTRRLLADVNEPATAAFFTAYSKAQHLHTKTIPADTGMITAFVDAVIDARRRFDIADENARRKARLGISHDGHHLTTDERRKIDQAQKLMRQAHDLAVTEAHAHNALTKALNLLDAAGVVVPERLTANITKSIEANHRRALACEQALA